jgi:hypothetical protein
MLAKVIATKPTFEAASYFKAQRELRVKPKLAKAVHCVGNPSRKFL